MTSLLDQHCQSCEGGRPLTAPEAGALLSEVPGWSMNDEVTRLSRSFRFGNYYETMAFVNAIAWIAHREDHHPDLVVGYNRCEVRLSTHAVKGLSANDFIVAARITALVPSSRL